MINSLKKAIYILLPLLVYYIAHDVVRILCMYILQMSTRISPVAKNFIVSHDTTFSAFISIIDMLAGALVLLFLMKRDYEELSIWDYLNLNTIGYYREDKIHSATVSWIIIIVQGICAAVGLNMLFTITEFGMNSSFNQTSQAQFSLPIWIGVILYGVISPAVEELLFRLIIFGRMKRCFPYVVAVIVSSLFFGLYHRNLVQGVYGTVMGILMCLAVEYLHTVVAGFVFHAVANLSVYLLISFNVFGTSGNIIWCSVFLGVSVVSIVWEVLFSRISYKKYGYENGVERVGCFFIDETLL